MISLKQLLPKRLKRTIKRLLLNREYRNWENSGKSIPLPHKVKQANILTYQKRFSLTVLIETGTFLGEMVSAMIPHFEKIYSIELSSALADLAKLQFKTISPVQIIEGDSSQELEKILLTINEPCLIWLDGHYSGGNTARGEKESPVMEELAAIAKCANLHSVICIDDARLFIGTNDYPTIPALEKWTTENMPSHQMTTENDMITIMPC